MRAVVEAAIGTVDGANTTFQTSATYVPGTVLVFLNGQLQRKEVVQELGNRTFIVDDAPDAEDILYVRYNAPV